MATQQRVPTGIGTASNWQLGAGTDRVDAVDDTIGANDGDTTYIDTTVSGQRQDYTFSAFTVPAGSTISKVTLYGYFKFVGTGAQIRLNLRNELGTFSEDADQTVASSASYGVLSRDLTTNPWTSAAWTVNEVNSNSATSNRIAEIEVRSIAPNTAVRCTSFYIEVTYTESGGGGTTVRLLTLLGVG